jgi:hypothetical protein
MDSVSLEEFNRRFKIQKALKYTMLSISFVTSFVKIYIEYVEPDPFRVVDFFKDIESILELLVVGMTLRILGNIFMLFFAVHNIIYFIKIK